MKRILVVNIMLIQLMVLIGTTASVVVAFHQYYSTSPTAIHYNNNNNNEKPNCWSSSYDYQQQQQQQGHSSTSFRRIVAFQHPRRRRRRRQGLSSAATTTTEEGGTTTDADSCLSSDENHQHNRIQDENHENKLSKNATESRTTLTFVADETFFTDTIVMELPTATSSSSSSSSSSTRKKRADDYDVDAFLLAKACEFLRTADPSLLLLMTKTSSTDDSDHHHDQGVDDTVGTANNNKDGEHSSVVVAVVNPSFQATPLSDLSPEERDEVIATWIQKAASFDDVATLTAKPVPPLAEIPKGHYPSPMICDVTTPAISFPGFRVESFIRLGVQYVEHQAENDDVAGSNNKNNMNGYQFVQLDDSTAAYGLKPLVWAHDRLTGKGKAKKDGGMQRARSFCTIQPVIVDIDDDNDDIASSDSNSSPKKKGIQLEYKVFLEVQLQFPSFLTKLLPMRSVERANGWGSSALTKTVTKNAPENLQRLFRAAENELLLHNKYG